MIAGLQPYPAYKDSGVPWLGEVPEHWGVLPNRAVFVEVKERDHPEEQMLSVTITKGVIRQQALLVDSSKKDSSNQDKSAYKLVRPGDIAYNKMRAWQGAVGVSGYQGIVSPAYVVQRPRGGSDSHYFHYLLRTPAFAKEAERWSYGITSDMWSLRPQHFKMIYGCLPPLPEQSAIVRFLDHADRRIRRYIRAKQKLIGLLEEQKQAIIHRAVTRGLDPNVRLKPSGVEWLGDVPEHWEILALKRVLRRLIDCEHKTAPAVDTSEYRVARTSAVRNGHIRLEGTYCTTKEAYREWTRRGVPQPGDVIFTREAPAGEACLVPSDQNICLGQRTVLMKVRPSNYDPHFLVHMIYAGPPRVRIQLASQGSTVGHFNMDDIGWMAVLKPPLGEQRAIVKWIAQSTQVQDFTIDRARAEIALVREYRTRLIADVVTGKLDVREAAAGLPEEAEELEPLEDAEPLDEDAEGADVGDLESAPEEAEV